ncbi:MAG: cell division protein FtsZ [Buchnera aphidicola (Meitanaphis microgallis)]
MFEPVEKNNDAIIRVVGIGGGGGNAVEHMVREQIKGVEFFAINTDTQALRKIEVGTTIQIGNHITKGLGAGANPIIGKNAAEEDRENLKSTLEGADMVFIAAGMGGGTGTGAAPVIAEITKELGILTVAVVTKPFNFEGKKRMAYADQGIKELSKYVDSLITIPNDKLLKVLNKGISLLDAFNSANNILKGAVQGIAELITKPGLINVDFADIRTVMSEMGYAMMGTGISSGDNRAKEAAEIAISSPLLEDIDLSGAQGVLVNITSGFNMKLDEFETVGNIIRSFSSDNATVVIGTSLDTDMNDTLRVTVVATGIGIEKPSMDVYLSKNMYSNKSLLKFEQKQHESFDIENQTIEAKKQKINNNFDTLLKRNNTNYLDIPTFLRRKSK